MIDAEGKALGVTAANWLDAPYNRWGFRHVPELCRTAAIARGDGPVRELPRAERDLADFAFTHGGRRFTLDEMLEETFTDGFLVIHDGAVVTERYLAGMRETRHAPADVVLEVADVDPLRRPRRPRPADARTTS